VLEVLIGFVSGPGIRRGDLPGAGAKPAPDALHGLLVQPRTQAPQRWSDHGACLFPELPGIRALLAEVHEVLSQ